MIMAFLIRLIISLIDVYTFVIFASVIISWIRAFGGLNMTVSWVFKLVNGVESLTVPLFDLIRKRIPSAGGLDFSPLIVLLILYCLQRFLWNMLIRL